MSPNQTKKPKSIRVGNFQPKVGGKKPETTQKRHRWPCLTSNFKSHRRLATNFFRPTSALWGWPELHFVTAIFRNLVQPPQQPHVVDKEAGQNVEATWDDACSQAKLCSACQANLKELEWGGIGMGKNEKHCSSERSSSAKNSTPSQHIRCRAKPTEKIAENMATFLQKKKFDFGGKKWSLVSMNPCPSNLV